MKQPEVQNAVQGTIDEYLNKMFFLISLMIIILLFVLHYYYNAKFDFWKKRGIPGPKPVPFFGTMREVILNRTSLSKYVKEVYETYKKAPLVGIFYRSTPLLIVKDPLLIKDIFITDATVFGSRGKLYSKKADPLSFNIFHMSGKDAKYIRTKVSPIFTSSKLANMVPLLFQRTMVFKEWLDTQLLQNDQIDCNDVMQKLTADIATACMYGYDLKSIRDGKNEIIEYARNWSCLTWKNSIQQLMMEIAMPLYDLIGYYVFNNVQLFKIFARFVDDIKEYRKRHNIVKHDIASILLDYKENLAAATGASIDEYIAASFFGFFIAAFETTATTISNTLYELALNHAIQNRLREEIRNVYLKTNGEITFDDVNAMRYLDAVVKETLRKYPIAEKIVRSSSSVYTFKDTKITVPKNQVIFIPVNAIHHDAEIYPKPEIFDPERFLNKTTPSEQSMLYIPFGNGPRNCIGERFGMLQTKIGLLSFLQTYKVDICQKTTIPYENNPEIFVERSVGIYLRITKCV